MDHWDGSIFPHWNRKISTCRWTNRATDRQVCAEGRSKCPLPATAKCPCTQGSQYAALSARSPSRWGSSGVQIQITELGLCVSAQPPEVGGSQALCTTILSEMWLRLISVVAEFCFSPFLVADQETASDAPEQSSLASQTPQEPTSMGKSQNHWRLKRNAWSEMHCLVYIERILLRFVYVCGVYVCAHVVCSLVHTCVETSG